MSVAEQLGLSSINWSGIGSMTGTVTLWTVSLLLVAGLIYFVWWITSFRHTVIIKEPIGRAFEYEKSGYYVLDNKVGKDVKEVDKEKDKTGQKIKILPFIGSIHKGKIITKKNVKKLRLLFPGINLKIPDNVFQGMTNKGKKFIELTKISEHIYAPTILNEADTNVIIYDESYFSWVVNDIEQDQLKYNASTFWDKYGNFIMSAGTLVLCLIIIVVVLKHSEQLVTNVANVAKPLADKLGQVAEKLGNQNI